MSNPGATKVEEAFDDALREAEVASTSGSPQKAAEALCYASDLIDRVNHYVDPPREGDPDVNPVTEELRKGSRSVQAAAPALVAALT